ncbi:endoribonuclease [Roseovarius sp. 22II1-1F6A]|nr:endoribonuclease [Roseovarius sp. 22II1-1F6A]
MTIERIEPGARMSQAVVHNGTVYLAGQVGTGADITEQSKSALAEVDRLLAAVGSDKSRILSTTVWVSDMALFADMNAVWDAWVDPANPPARATGEAKLATPDNLVEFIVTAAVG